MCSLEGNDIWTNLDTITIKYILECTICKVLSFFIFFIFLFFFYCSGFCHTLVGGGIGMQSAFYVYFILKKPTKTYDRHK